jgi:hypothetical protein
MPRLSGPLTTADLMGTNGETLKVAYQVLDGTRVVFQFHCLSVSLFRSFTVSAVNLKGVWLWWLSRDFLERTARRRPRRHTPIARPCPVSTSTLHSRCHSLILLSACFSLYVYAVLWCKWGTFWSCLVHAIRPELRMMNIKNWKRFVVRTPTYICCKYFSRWSVATWHKQILVPKNLTARIRDHSFLL